MKIVGVEHRHALERLEIGNEKLAALKLDEPSASKGLQSAVDVDRSETGGVGQIRLGERPVTTIAVGQPQAPKPNVHLAKDVSDSFQRASLADVRHPFAGNGRVDELVEPQRPGERSALRHKSLEVARADLGIFERSDSGDGVIHLAENEDVGVAQIAGDEEMDRLAAAIRELLVAAGPAFEDEVDPIGLFALADQIATRRQIANRSAGGAMDEVSIFVGKPDKGFKVEFQKSPSRLVGLDSYLAGVRCLLVQLCYFSCRRVTKLFIFLATAQQLSGESRGSRLRQP